MADRFINRDISWLSFNGRVLEEAARERAPLLERFNFLSIFSSNLDEFYRVRMSPLMLLEKSKHPTPGLISGELQQAQSIIAAQQERFGSILTGQLIPALRLNHIRLAYQEAPPSAVTDSLKDYFLSVVTAFLQVIYPAENSRPFFAKSNQLYLCVQTNHPVASRKLVLVAVPSDKLPRFFQVMEGDLQHIVFLEDIIKLFLPMVFPGIDITGAWNIKITRDADLDLADEFNGDLAEKIEKKLAKRDEGYPTRFLYEAGFPVQQLYALAALLRMSGTVMMRGGRHHNLKDFASLPTKQETLGYAHWPPLTPPFLRKTMFPDSIGAADRIIHTPYHTYDAVLRFFNSAAIDEQVSEIYVTLYRVAGNSRIVHSLITAAENGKQVTVFIELKARFDEENNIRWSKRMKAAGIRIINSIPGLKVHAKVALIKKKEGARFRYHGLLATGNLNESTARFYTDHVLFTAAPDLTRELELLFIFLQRRRKPANKSEIVFRQLLVSQFNLQDRFLELIDREIAHAREGRPAGIILKMNNLEEQVLIEKLYDASRAGVNIQLLVRSICCLQPGVSGMSERIRVTRIVDRYLEHGRLFIFHNAGEEEIWMGSADWMNRNIYRRIEVCFPIRDAAIKMEIRALVDLQLRDNVQAVYVNTIPGNEPVQNNQPAVQSQQAIYHLLKNKIPDNI